MIDGSYPRELLCAHCNSFLQPPLLVLSNCGHGIHTNCYAAIKDRSLSSSCRRCTALIVTACPDEELERCMGVIANISQSILHKTPRIDASLLKKMILFQAIAAEETGIVRILLADDVPPERMDEVASLFCKKDKDQQDDLAKNLLEKDTAPLSITGPSTVLMTAEDVEIRPPDTPTPCCVACKIVCLCICSCIFPRLKF